MDRVACSLKLSTVHSSKTATYGAEIYRRTTSGGVAASHVTGQFRGRIKSDAPALNSNPVLAAPLFDWRKMEPLENVTNKFVKVPNWFFDEILPVAPNSFSCLLAFIFRKTIGWDDDEFKLSIADISRACHVDKETVSRWLHVLRMVSWIEYKPSRNGGGKSQIVLGRLADRKTARTVAEAIIHARELERKWSRDNATVERSDYSSYVEWTKKPRRGAAGFAMLMENYLLQHGFHRAENTAPTVPRKMADMDTIDQMLDDADREFRARERRPEVPAALSGDSANAERTNRQR